MAFKKTGDASKDYAVLNPEPPKNKKASGDREEAELAKKHKLAGDLTNKPPKKTP